MSSDKLAASFGGVPQPVCTVRPSGARGCGRPHRPDLPCWSGRYAVRVTRRTLLLQGRVCWICGQRADTADHILPRSLGGTDAPGNLRPACRSCNSRRGNARSPFGEEQIAPRGAPLSERWLRR